MGPPISCRISRVRHYSGFTVTLSAFRLRDSYPLRLRFPALFDYANFSFIGVHYPESLAFGLGSFHFARRYFGNRCFFLFLPVLRCFSSRSSLRTDYIFIRRYRDITPCGLPHSVICGSMDICSSPQLFAACHDLRRLPVPRHPPYALNHLTNGL